MSGDAVGHSLRRRLSESVARWARRRQGADELTVSLRRRRIYILPTRFGVIFGCLVFAMLLGSLNYGVSLAYALTFLLTGLGLVTLHHCHNNLLGLELRFAGAQPVFAGEDARFRIALSNTSRAARYDIELGAAGRESDPADVPSGGTAVLHVTVPTERRGYVALPRFTVATRHPGNLCRAWTYVHMEAKCLVYPRPAPPGRPVPPAAAGNGERPTSIRGDTDFAGLRHAVRGDPPRRIAWKAYARSGDLLLKEFSGGEAPIAVFDWNSLRGVDTEERLSQLTRWCLDAAAEGRSFGLKLPAEAIGVGSGDRHLHRCLAALALYPGAAGSTETAI
ncbi:MAG: DUF58 domain-containing protein [Gammaproteobacteria bacterium]|nr:DUF58 domain-containing protein [Gammaproteobacteria bacterium]